MMLQALSEWAYTFLAWALGWTSHRLATPSNSRLLSPRKSLGRTDCRLKVIWLGWVLGTVVDSFIMLKNHKL